jgi:hypothetical protein
VSGELGANWSLCSLEVVPLLLDPHRGRRTARLESELRHDAQRVAKASGSFAIFRPGAVHPAGA